MPHILKGNIMDKKSLSLVIAVMVVLMSLYFINIHNSTVETSPEDHKGVAIDLPVIPNEPASTPAITVISKVEPPTVPASTSINTVVETETVKETTVDTTDKIDLYKFNDYYTKCLMDAYKTNKTPKTCRDEAEQKAKNQLLEN